MRACSLVLVVLACACNSVLGLHATRKGDAGELVDRDGDGVPDLSDNCPAIANPGQEDLDADGTGDVCDSCPLVANRQSEDFDHDGVGDACDADPTATGDCLLLLDRFPDAAGFAAHWTVLAMPGDPAPPDVRLAGPGELEIVPHPGYPIAVVSNDASGANSVQILGHASAAGGLDTVSQLFGGLLDQASVTTGYRCALSITTIQAAIEGISDTYSNAVFGVPVSDEFLIRSTVHRAGDASRTVSVGCKIDWGFASGVGVLTTSGDPMYAGPPGVQAIASAISVSAIAAFGRASPCPAPIIR